MDKSLSDTEIDKLCNYKVNIITYPDLATYDNIDDLLEPYGNLVILYETKKGYGHWVALMKMDNNTLEFFDPYGGKPDDQLKFIPEHFRIENNEYHTHLIYLLLKSRYKITYNEHKLQKFLEDINTCGRWVCLRILFKNMSLKDFNKMVRSFPDFTPDELVTYLTSFV
jgi:hypothetical protein